MKSGTILFVCVYLYCLTQGRCSINNGRMREFKIFEKGNEMKMLFKGILPVDCVASRRPSLIAFV